MYKERMKELRTLELITQDNMAIKLNMGRSAYSQYEKEYIIIPLKHLNNFCNYFNVSLDYIFGFSDNKSYDFKSLELDKKIVGNRIKEFRKEVGITQEVLAKELNIGNGTIADYERGRYLIATPFIYTICKKYKYSADYLLGKVDEPKYIK